MAVLELALLIPDSSIENSVCTFPAHACETNAWGTLGQEDMKG